MSTVLKVVDSGEILYYSRTRGPINMLIHSLIEKQQAQQLSNTQFARRLGISRALWDLVRTGKRGFGERTLSGIVRAYPELIPEVLLFLRGDTDERVKRRKKDSG